MYVNADNAGRTIIKESVNENSTFYNTDIASAQVGISDYLRKEVGKQIQNINKQINTTNRAKGSGIIALQKGDMMTLVSHGTAEGKLSWGGNAISPELVYAMLQKEGLIPETVNAAFTKSCFCGVHNIFKIHGNSKITVTPTYDTKAPLKDVIIRNGQYFLGNDGNKIAVGPENKSRMFDIAMFTEGGINAEYQKNFNKNKIYDTNVIITEAQIDKVLEQLNKYSLHSDKLYDKTVGYTIGLDEEKAWAELFGVHQDGTPIVNNENDVVFNENDIVNNENDIINNENSQDQLNSEKINTEDNNNDIVNNENNNSEKINTEDNNNDIVNNDIVNNENNQDQLKSDKTNTENNKNDVVFNENNQDQLNSDKTNTEDSSEKINTEEIPEEFEETEEIPEEFEETEEIPEEEIPEEFEETEEIPEEEIPEEEIPEETEEIPEEEIPEETEEIEQDLTSATENTDNLAHKTLSNKSKIALGIAAAVVVGTIAIAGAKKNNEKDKKQKKNIYDPQTKYQNDINENDSDIAYNITKYRYGHRNIM
jgi:hypothetical protein